MENMSSSVHSQISSIMDVLSKAAVAEISKVVEDGLVLLRLEICDRQNQIETLKKNLNIITNQLRATRRALVRECVSTRSTNQGIRTERESGNEDLNGLREEVSTSASGVKVKLEDEEQMVQDTNQNTRTALGSHTENEQIAQAWTSEEHTEMHSPEYFHSTYDQSQHRSNPGVSNERSFESLEGKLETMCPNGEDTARQNKPSTENLHAATNELLRAQNGPGHEQVHVQTHNTLINPHPETQSNFSSLGIPERERPVNGGVDVDKRRFPCIFCGKSFDRLSHVERHQRIHTGEKPFSCRLCGRCFTQKSSLKSHLKTHRGFGEGTEGVPGLHNEDNHFSNDWHMVPPCEEQITPESYTNSQEIHKEEQNSHSASLGQESICFIHTEEERLKQPDIDQQPVLSSPNSSPADRTKRCADFSDFQDHNDDGGDDDDDDVVCVSKDGTKTEKQEEDKNQTEFTPETTRLLSSGTESVMDEEEPRPLTFINASTTGKDSVESDCSVQTEYSLHQSKYQLEPTSAIIHSWANPAVTNTKSFQSNHVHVKEEEEDISAVDEEDTVREISYTMQHEEPNVALPIDQISAAASFRTAEALMVPDLSSNLLHHSSSLVNGVQKRRERRFFCVLCGKNFDRLSHLERHQRIHTGEKPYSCSMCGRSFTQKSSLKGHMQTHTRERPFHCHLCGMSFPTRAGRYRHWCQQSDTTGHLR